LRPDIEEEMVPTDIRYDGAMSELGVRRDKAALSSGCKSHPAIALQPEAAGAAMEVTK
jgi:hypothetical protein